MKNIELAQEKLEQKKARLVMEETRLKLQERKRRTKRLIEIGALVVKAELDFLSSNAIYGGLLEMQKQLSKDKSIVSKWESIGKNAFEREQKLSTPVILSFQGPPASDVKTTIRSYNLRWNSFRKEWYGLVKELDALKDYLAENLDNADYNLEIIQGN